MPPPLPSRLIMWVLVGLAFLGMFIAFAALSQIGRYLAVCGDCQGKRPCAEGQGRLLSETCSVNYRNQVA